MESSDVIAYRDVIIKTSSYAFADVIVTEVPPDDVDRCSSLSNGHTEPDENLQFVEAVSIAATEIEQQRAAYHEETRRSSTGDSDDLPKASTEGVETCDGGADNDDGGDRVAKQPREGEQAARTEPPFKDDEARDHVIAKHDEGPAQSALIERLQRLAVSERDPRPRRRTDPDEIDDRLEDPDACKQQAQQTNSKTYTADVLARGPTGGTAVAYPLRTLNGGWSEQPRPGAKRSPQFLVGDYADFGNEILVDATGKSPYPAEDFYSVEPSKFRRGPQPVESDDLSPLDDPSLSFISLSPKEIAEVLGADDDWTNILDDFFLPDIVCPDPDDQVRSKRIDYHEFSPYSPGDHLSNDGGVFGSPSILQRQCQEQPFHFTMTALPSTDPLPAASPLSQAPTLATHPTNKFFHPSHIHDTSYFCDGALNVGGCTGFREGEASPAESGFGGSDYSQSPHPSTLDNPGREDDFPLEPPPPNLAEIEAILSFIANDVVQLPPGKQSLNPPSTNYRFPLENPLAKQTTDASHHPPSSAVESFHPVHSSPVQVSSFPSLPINTSPANPAGPRVRPIARMTGPEGSAEPTMRRIKDTNSTVTMENQTKADQLLNERKQLAKASSVIARLTRDQLVMPDCDQDTLLHLAIAKNEQYLTEALISRLERDKLIDSMINLKNKQGQTPLCLATVTNQWTLVRLLVDRGADVNVRIPLGDRQAKSFCNPLHFAASNGREWIRTLEELLRAKTLDLSALDSEGCSALHKSVMTNGLSLFYGRNCEVIDSRKSVGQLILRGSDVSQQDGVQSRTVLHIALEKGDLDMFNYILELSAPRVSLPLLLNARTGRRGDTLLHVAAALQTDLTHQLTFVRRMLSLGANTQLRNWDNRLPWELATRAQVAEVLKIPVAGGL